MQYTMYCVILYYNMYMNRYRYIIIIVYEEWLSGSRRSKVYYSIDRFVSRCENAACSRGRAKSPRHWPTDPKRAAPPLCELRLRQSL